MLVLGVDPDLHHAGVGLVADGSRILSVACPCVRTSLRGTEAIIAMTEQMQAAICGIFFTYGTPDLAVVEGQESYLGSKVRPQDLLNLAIAAGIAAGLAKSLGASRLLIPRPQTWKGSIPKAVHQKRILSRLKIPYAPGEVPTRILMPPSCFAGITKGNYTHVIDALGLACWGETQ